jgi:Protein of unknown function (DUF3060)
MKSKLLIFFIGGLICSACNYKPLDTKPEANAANSQTQTNQNSKNQSNQQENGNNDDGGKLVLTGTSKSASYPCNGREVEIDADTTAGKYTFTGECKKLVVDGVASTVWVEKVGEIVVKGVSNKVIYGEGIGGKKPKITKTEATTATVQSKAEAEKKESQAK